MGRGEGNHKPEHGQSFYVAYRLLWSPGTLCSAARCTQAQAQVYDMANDLLDKIPAWLKSLWDMENKLRSAARNGLILRKDEASAPLAEARRHLEKAMN